MAIFIFCASYNIPEPTPQKWPNLANLGSFGGQSVAGDRALTIALFYTIYAFQKWLKVVINRECLSVTME